MPCLHNHNLSGSLALLSLALAACATASTQTATQPPTGVATAGHTAAVILTTQPSPTTMATTSPPTATSVLLRLLTATPLFTPPPPSQRDTATSIYSPNGQYYLLFAPDGTRVYRTADQQLISQSDVVVYPILDPIEVVWAPNSLEAATTDFIHTILWFTDGRAPHEVSWSIFSLSWSPDSAHLAGMASPPPDRHPILVIIQANGTVSSVGDTGIGPTEGVDRFVWITHKIVQVSSTDGTCCRRFVDFNADTRRFYPSWETNVDGEMEASFSPDGVWRLARSSYRLSQNEQYSSAESFEHIYTVLNFETGQYYKLYDGSNQEIDWVGWTPDSETFYFINRPASPTAVANADLPFGWLALSPATHMLKMIFAQAIFAQLSTDQTQACVVLPAKDSTGQLGLDAGWYNLTTGVVTGRQHIADQVPYSSRDNRGLLPPGFAADKCRLN